MDLDWIETSSNIPKERDIDITEPTLWLKEVLRESNRSTNITPVEQYSFNQEEMNEQFRMEKEYQFPSEEQINWIKTRTEKKMKTKKYYHTFKFENRTINICLLVEDYMWSTAKLKVGYSVCLPEDDYNEEIAKRISLGRASKKKARLDAQSMPNELAFSLKVLKGIAEHYERQIKKGKLVIKGIR